MGAELAALPACTARWLLTLSAGAARDTTRTTIPTNGAVPSHVAIIAVHAMPSPDAVPSLVTSTTILPGPAGAADAAVRLGQSRW